MPPRSDLQSRLASVLVTIAPESNLQQLGLLEDLLARSSFEEGDLSPRQLSIERATWNDPGNLGAVQQERLEALLQNIPQDIEPGFRVFRREVAVTSPMLDLTTPAWGRGALIEQSLGPFQSQDGRQFWFDFFPIIRLVPVYLAGEIQPAMLLHERTFILAPALGTHVRLEQSSFWLRANLLTSAAPVGTYVGLRIRNGSLAFSTAPVEVGGRLTMPAGARCSIDLNLEPTQQPAPAESQAGSDAASAQLTTPDRFAFDLQAGHARATAITRAEWNVYGDSLQFEWIEGSTPTYEASLSSVLIPFRPSAGTFSVRLCRSPFVRLDGQAAIEESGWSLPVASVDPANPPEAAGVGGLALRTGDHLTLSWRGLRDGPIQLRMPWIAAGPGTLAIVDPKASNRYAHQRFLLWKDADSRSRSELDLQVTESFSARYISAFSGNELVATQADMDARMDRPVDVKSTPLPVHTVASLLVLTYSDARQSVGIYEDDILADSLEPGSKWPIQPGHLVSLAIRNALFTISPVNSFLLFGDLQDEETLRDARLFLAMGLFGLLPTLPDPYAANVRWLRAYGRHALNDQRPALLLIATVAWTKAATDLDPDPVATSFAFAPLTEASLVPWTEASQNQALQAAMYAISDNQGRWDVFFKEFENEQFALVDVSSNADQMGVSFAWFNSRALTERDLVFYQVYGAAPDTRQPDFPVEVHDLDLSAQSRFVRPFMLPQVSWEPLINFGTPDPTGTNPPLPDDPPVGWNLYANDGGPTRLFNNSVRLVPIAPLPVIEFFVKDFQDNATGFAGALFTLPFGLRTFAQFSSFHSGSNSRPRAKLALDDVRPEFEGGVLRGALQLRADAPPYPGTSPAFAGTTLQLNNVLTAAGLPTGAGTLGHSVGEIFNNQFFFDPPVPIKPAGVPLSRIDFGGYGASMFSHWEDPSAAIAATSKSYFDVFLGRTAQEVIQVRSLVYPWGFRVVRTITMTRASDAYVFRFDTGWQPESDGVYDFRYNVFVGDRFNKVLRDSPYEFHPGLVKGVFSVRNIRETAAVPPFDRTWNKNNGDTYLDADGIERTIDGSTAAMWRTAHVLLQPVYFDADVEVEGVISGAVGGRVPSTGMLGYVQLAPRGEPIPARLFKELLESQFGALGGPVACTIDIGKSGQQMRINRVDVNASQDGAKPIFVSAARGALVLPKDGSWSVVAHNNATQEVSPLDPQASVPLIRRGRLLIRRSRLSQLEETTTDTTAADLMRVANPIDIVSGPGPTSRNFGLLQSTTTQKTLFRLPAFQPGVPELKSTVPDFADAYRLINSKGIFPNIKDALPLNLGTFKPKILPQGYRLLDDADPNRVFEQVLPKTPLALINEQFLKLYVEYFDGGVDGRLRYALDASAATLANQWQSKLNNITMVVDLGPLKRLMLIRGSFDAEKGSLPSFREPRLEFGPDLRPVVDILQILQQLQGGDYRAAFQKGLEIAMSNSADSWTYAFHARKEIPLVKFPPPAVASPADPLKLEAHLAVGVYFNEALALPNAPGQLIPSAGAFLEFGGSLSVMCVSLAAATVYAVGMVDLRIAADIKTGPSLHMKFGFGAEIAVGLPVVGTVSLLYAVGVELDLDTGSITVAALLLFRGRAELLEGVVTVQIQIEAKGIYHRTGSETDLAAQVTFGLDVSIFLVINIHFSKSWQESRQIA